MKHLWLIVSYNFLKVIYFFKKRQEMQKIQQSDNTDDENNDGIKNFNYTAGTRSDIQDFFLSIEEWAYI